MAADNLLCLLNSLVVLQHSRVVCHNAMCSSTSHVTRNKPHCQCFSTAGVTH
jgi:hypothetical protein